MLIMPPPQEMSLVQNIRSITIIANDILYNKLVQHINADLKLQKMLKRWRKYFLCLKINLQKI